MSLYDGLVSFWKLGEAAGNSRLDSISFNHLVESAATVASGAGKIGNAAVFDQTNFLRRSLSLASGLSRTIIAWPSINASITNDFPAIVSKWAHTDQRSYSLLYDRTGAIGGTANRFVFLVSSDGTGGANSASVVANNFGALSTGTFYFVAAYVDLDADIIGIQVNNVENTNSYTFSGVFDSAADLEIGHLGTADQTFYGTIDAVGIWSRRLDSTELATLWNNGNGLEPPFPSSVIPYFGSGHLPYQRIRRVTSY